MNYAYTEWTDRARARTHGKQVNFFSLSSLISPSSTHEPALTKNSFISRILVCDLTLQFASQRMLISPELTLEKNNKKKNQTKTQNSNTILVLGVDQNETFYYGKKKHSSISLKHQVFLEM